MPTPTRRRHSPRLFHVPDSALAAIAERCEPVPLFKNLTPDDDRHFVWSGAMTRGRPVMGATTLAMRYDDIRFVYPIYFVWKYTGRPYDEFTSLRCHCGEPRCLNPNHYTAGARMSERRRTKPKPPSEELPAPQPPVFVEPTREEKIASLNAMIYKRVEFLGETKLSQVKSFLERNDPDLIPLLPDALQYDAIMGLEIDV